MRFYGYKHWTVEDTPRCFYVGRGVINRSKSHNGRNHKWHAIIKRFGLRVEVCIGPVTNEEANVWEIETIALMKTFSSNHLHDDPNDIGCNFTKGGEGITGWTHSDEAKRKNSASNQVSCSGENNGMFGKHHSEETRKKIGDNQRGWHHSEETKIKLAEHAKRLHTGKKRSKKTRQNMSNSRLGKSPWNKGKKLGKRKIKRVFSEQARKNISEARKGKPPWNKGKKKTVEST